MGLREKLSKLPIIKFFIPSDSLVEKSYDWVKYFGNFGFAALTSLMIVYIPLVIANDQEKQSLQRIISVAYGVKLDTRDASAAAAQSANINLV